MNNYFLFWNLSLSLCYAYSVSFTSMQYHPLQKYDSNTVYFHQNSCLSFLLITKFYNTHSSEMFRLCNIPQARVDTRVTLLLHVNKHSLLLWVTLRLPGHHQWLAFLSCVLSTFQMLHFSCLNTWPNLQDLPFIPFMYKDQFTLLGVVGGAGWEAEVRLLLLPLTTLTFWLS